MDIFPEGTVSVFNCLTLFLIVSIFFAGIGAGVFIGWLIWAGGC